MSPGRRVSSEDGLPVGAPPFNARLRADLEDRRPRQRRPRARRARVQGRRPARSLARALLEHVPVHAAHAPVGAGHSHLAAAGRAEGGPAVEARLRAQLLEVFTNLLEQLAADTLVLAL